MRRLLLVGLLLGVQTPSTPEPLVLEAQVHQLKVQLAQAQLSLAQCQAQRASELLSAERKALEARFRQLLKPSPSAVFSWETLTFVEPKP